MLPLKVTSQNSLYRNVLVLCGLFTVIKSFSNQPFYPLSQTDNIDSDKLIPLNPHYEALLVFH